MLCLSAKMHRLCTICMLSLLLHATRGQMVGSAILPLSMDTRTVCLHTLQAKKASFMSGITVEARITRPLTLINLSMSAGSRSRILTDLSSPKGKTLYVRFSTSSTRSGSSATAGVVAAGAEELIGSELSGGTELPLRAGAAAAALCRDCIFFVASSTITSLIV